MPRQVDPFAVLVVEDDPDHGALVQAAFSYRDVNADIRVTATAEEACFELLPMKQI